MSVVKRRDPTASVTLITPGHIPDLGLAKDRVRKEKSAQIFVRISLSFCACEKTANFAFHIWD